MVRIGRGDTFPNRGNNLKKFLLAVVLTLFLVIPSMVVGAECSFPTGTQAILITGQGLQAVTSNREVPVDIAEDQPTMEMLEELSMNVPGDWTDAVVVEDANGYSVIVHRGDLTCPKN